jgi:predicted dehydrogenase
MINVGLIGFGYWGPNLARNFSFNPDLELTAICDFSSDRLKAAKQHYPQVNLYKDLDDFFNDTALDAIAIATPVATHFKLAKKAISSGRHVWLEKPMTETVPQAEELIELAEQKNKVLLVDHTFVYTGAVRKIKEVIDKGELGDMIYYDSTRVNLGLFQQDINVVWDLAPHDISIMDYLMPFKKVEVSATGSHYYGNGIVPKSLLTVYMENNTIAHINVSWVSPVKYDKGVVLGHTMEELYRLKVQYRVGDMYAPKIDDQEALAFESSHFADCLINGKKPLTDGKAGLEVVKVLVAAEKSLKLKGTPVQLD